MAEEGDKKRQPSLQLAPVMLLAAAYASGFVLWGGYNASQGLGFLPLETPRYLAAGFGVLLIAIPVSWLHWMSGGQDSKETKGVKAFLVPTLVLATWWGILRLMLPEFNILREASALDWVLDAVLVMMAGAATMYVPRLAVVRKEPSRERRPLRFFSSGTGTAFALVWILVSTVFLAIHWQDVNQGYGGAQPRQAWLDLAVEGVSPESLASLVEPGNSSLQAQETGTIRTRLLTIFYHDGDHILAAHPTDDGLLLDINMGYVSAILWRN